MVETRDEQQANAKEGQKAMAGKKKKNVNKTQTLGTRMLQKWRKKKQASKQQNKKKKKNTVK